MKVKLHDGEAFLRISHTKEFVEGFKEPRRGTHVWLDKGNGKLLEARSVCNPSDQFSRSMGRRVAVNRLLAEMRKEGAPEEDRITVFRAGCPEFDPDRTEKNG